MKKSEIVAWTLAAAMSVWLPASGAWADGGYFSRTRSVAISADQRAILIKNGDEISVTLSTGYTGDGDDFGWIIPTPVPPAVEDVVEAGKNGEEAFVALDRSTAPQFISSSRGCFPAGTAVLTADGPRAIATVEPGAKVRSRDPQTGAWVLATVRERQSRRYEGDVIAIRVGAETIRATGNHPFFVTDGTALASRPIARDVPIGERSMSERGRWVEARDLREGDVLTAPTGEFVVTALESRQDTVEVFNLDVEGLHTYAVGRTGVLVHNKGSMEPIKGEPLAVTVYGRVTLEHYEASILGAAAAAPLMDWLRANGYAVDPAAREVLDSYIARRWAFVAVKLNPGEKRHYQDEFLPPLTIRYRHDRLIFPLRISSVSTRDAVKITLYVIAESTASSSNLATTPLRFEETLPSNADAARYIEARIRQTIGDDGRGLAVLWSGAYGGKDWSPALSALMAHPFPAATKSYLTRLEARADSAGMREDIEFRLDEQPKQVAVKIWSSAAASSSYSSVAVDAADNIYAAGDMGYSGAFDTGKTVMAVKNPAGASLLLVKYSPSGVPSWARTPTTAADTSFFASVTVDSAGRVYAAGTMRGTGTFDFGAGVTAVCTTNSNRMVLAKYDPSGTPQWARTVVASSESCGFNAVAVDARGNVYAAGYISGVVAFDFGEEAVVIGSSKGVNLALVKYDSAGVPQWARTTAAGAGSSNIHSVAVDGGGHVYAAGDAVGTEALDLGSGVTAAGTSGAMLVKYSASGVPQWVRTPAAAAGTSTFASVTVDSAGGVYAAGYMRSEETFDFGAGVTAVSTTYGFSMVLVKYDSAGVPQWARTVAQASGPSFFESVAVDPNGGVYACGSIAGRGTYDFGSGVTAAGTALGTNAVLVKYDRSGVPQWARTTSSGSDSSLFTSIAVDAQGTIYAAGSIGSMMDYTFGAGVTASGSFYGPNVVLVKYDATGRALWARTAIADLY